MSRGPGYAVLCYLGLWGVAFSAVSWEALWTYLGLVWVSCVAAWAVVSWRGGWRSGMLPQQVFMGFTWDPIVNSGWWERVRRDEERARALLYPSARTIDVVRSDGAN